LSARWTVIDQNRKEAPNLKESRLARPAKEKSTDASVAALTETVADLSREIAKTVIALESIAGTIIPWAVRQAIGQLFTEAPQKGHRPNASGFHFGANETVPMGWQLPADWLAVADRMALGSIAKSVLPVEIVQAEEAHTVFYPRKKHFLFYTQSKR
jgi:ABC-type transport auxiliary lipoprotein component